MGYRSLTTKEREALPLTYGASPYRSSTYFTPNKSDDLEYSTVIDEFETALNIGLENYIDSASWEICTILRSSVNTNKLAMTWQLYIRAVHGNWKNQQINTAWKSYSQHQRDYIAAVCASYLNSCVDYLQEWN